MDYYLPQNCTQAPVAPRNPVWPPATMGSSGRKHAPPFVTQKAVKDLEIVAHMLQSVPQYHTVRDGGQDHRPLFRTHVSLPPHNLYAEAVGGSKAASRHAAATALLYNIDPNDPASSLPNAPEPPNTASDLRFFPPTGPSQSNDQPIGPAREYPEPKFVSNLGHRAVKEEDRTTTTQKWRGLRDDEERPEKRFCQRPNYSPRK